MSKYACDGLHITAVTEMQNGLFLISLTTSLTAAPIYATLSSSAGLLDISSSR